MRVCADSHEPTFLAGVISTEIACTGQYLLHTVFFFFVAVPWLLPVLGRVGLWSYVREHPKAQPAVVQAPRL